MRRRFIAVAAVQWVLALRTTVRHPTRRLQVTSDYLECEPEALKLIFRVFGLNAKSIPSQGSFTWPWNF